MFRRSGLVSWKDTLDRVAATAAAAVADGQKGENEGSDNKGEDDPEHDAVDDLHGSLTFFGKLTIKD